MICQEYVDLQQNYLQDGKNMKTKIFLTSDPTNIKET